MHSMYQTFLQLPLDLSALDFIRPSADDTPYFCTPKGADIIGWTGVDGIHFCFLPDFDDMVFSVSPMELEPDFVHPVAENFRDFLRLLLACGSTAAVEQAWMWNQAEFDDFLRDNPILPEQQAVMDALAAQLHLSAMPQPWQYLHKLQTDFDNANIKYIEDYDAELGADDAAGCGEPVCFAPEPQETADDANGSRDTEPHFRVAASGDTVMFVYPPTGAVHTLAVKLYEKETLSADDCQLEEWEYPSHFYIMCYAIEPPLPEDALDVADCASGDRMRKRQGAPADTAADKDKAQDSSAAAFGIIGGCGPTAVLSPDPTVTTWRTVCSAPHFEPVDSVEWRIRFHEMRA